jgi:D-tyrosyl-tRNA(Tyr) deacylase
MRAIIQRVGAAAVTVGGSTVGAIDRGLCVLVGIANGDTDSDLEYIAKKLLAIRLFPDANGKNWTKSVVDIEGSLLLVSQFTLCHVLKGNKPDFHNAMNGAESRPMFDKLVMTIQKAYRTDRVATGAFGEHMQVNIVNDGPVTITLDSRESSQGSPKTPSSTPSSPASPPSATAGEPSP